MKQRRPTFISGSAKTFSSLPPCTGMPSLKGLFLNGMVMTLCSVASLLRISRTWPVITPTMWGV